jgi:hypothetical protein
MSMTMAPRKIQVIHNGVIAEQFGIGITGKGPAAAVFSDGFFIGTAGRLSGKGGVPYRGRSRDGRLRPHCRRLRNELEERARKLGTRCRFLGMLSLSRCRLKSLDLFAFRPCGRPSVAPPRLLRGLPVVASDIRRTGGAWQRCCTGSRGDLQGLRQDCRRSRVVPS